jgi:hypothetical protein
VRRSRRLRWLCALLWAPLAVLAVSASSFSALRCTVSGLFIPESCCPMADQAPEPSNQAPAVQAPSCCERVTVSNVKAPAAGAPRVEPAAPQPAPLFAALMALTDPSPRRPLRPEVSVRPPGRAAPPFLLTHAFLI